MPWNPTPGYLAVLREYGLTEAQVAALVAPEPVPPPVAPLPAPAAPLRWVSVCERVPDPLAPLRGRA